MRYEFPRRTWDRVVAGEGAQKGRLGRDSQKRWHFSYRSRAVEPRRFQRQGMGRVWGATRGSVSGVRMGA